MSVTDPIADLLTRMRNANQMRYNEVVVPSSKLKLEIVKILKAEGYIKIDRRHGAVVADVVDMDLQFREKLEAELELLSAEASITGMDKKEFLKLCDGIYSKMKVCRQS